LTRIPNIGFELPPRAPTKQILCKKYPFDLVACYVLYFPPLLLTDYVQVLYGCRGVLALG
jgi:hypothetical protein